MLQNQSTITVFDVNTAFMSGARQMQEWCLQITESNAVAPVIFDYVHHYCIIKITVINLRERKYV